ncbi:hypothetical protein [Dyella tabacisoli]|uniref:Uncharacterized protein n=1 Tax=Dyella tabacisoli TaxID=2282381 RepID=A0A369UQV4_9GAMM|nr:hypothetical protein [Dyella tabacisoli]RDD82891.1 hypothetical protein DVJ77_05085 [Dyella tabacisoli]
MNPLVARWSTWLLLAVWIALLAMLPWWLGLTLLVALTISAIAFAHSAVGYANWCRRGLRWGLPGLLFAVQRSLGGDLLAWGMALLGALVGFSLLALLESLLDHQVNHTPQAKPSPEWSELAMAPLGPRASIIELQRVSWREIESVLTDPLGGLVHYQAGQYRFAAGRLIDGLSPRCCFSPGGRWFVASMRDGLGDVLWDRDGDRLHRLGGWQLCGWEGELPWLVRGEDGVPVGLGEVLGE